MLDFLIYERKKAISQNPSLHISDNVHHYLSQLSLTSWTNNMTLLKC